MRRLVLPVVSLLAMMGLSSVGAAKAGTVDQVHASTSSNFQLVGHAPGSGRGTRSTITLTIGGRCRQTPSPMIESTE